MKKIFYATLVAFLATAGINELAAQDLVYEPKNPSFGGETFNYQWMLSSAQAQNKIKNPEAEVEELDERDDPLANFSNNLNRLVLNELTRRLIANQFGEEGIKEGKFVLGNFEIDVSSGLDGLNVLIYDAATGNSTTVVIPTF